MVAARFSTAVVSFSVFAAAFLLRMILGSSGVIAFTCR